MARFTRIEVALKMKETGLVPLFYQPDIEIAKQLLSAIYKGGARLFEFTNRGDYGHVVFAELYKYAEEHMPDLIMGVGSVTDAGTASLYMQLGANFVVTPVMREDIAISHNSSCTITLDVSPTYIFFFVEGACLVRKSKNGSYLSVSIILSPTDSSSQCD